MIKKSKFAKLILAIMLCFLLVFLNSKSLLVPVRGVFFEIAYPFQKIFYIASGELKNAASFLSSISKLKKDNEKLIKENKILIAQIADLNDQKNENADLRRQLELAPRKEYELEAALVVGQSPANLGSWLMIDKGHLDGIEPGMPVVVFDGILIGKVSEAYLNSCKVLLLTDPSSFVNATDIKTGAVGILKGEYNLGLVLDMVEQADTLNEGDDIITSGLGGLMPRGFLIGKIQRIEENEEKLFQQAAVIPSIKYSKLNMVFVVKKET